MDSSTLLDYALFQLTPTRTRCDLLIFRGGKTEKLASGLFEPFVSHLKFAKDHISRGGYSIKLCPPTANAPWFTKGTFQRFVRFVSTPAVLERFVSLETEISEIESSVQAQGLLNFNASDQLIEGNGRAANADMRKSSDSSKPKVDLQKCDGDGSEENSKIQLQRLLETRKMLLCKEQAMAYAGGLAAGFEVDNIDDLIFFADAFGASRLREACINFKDLFKKKRGDDRWMEELAAMKAYPPSELSFLGSSAIVLSSDNSTLNQNASLSLPNGSTSTCDIDSVSRSDSTASLDGKKDESLTTSANAQSATNSTQAPMPWPNQIPPYMYHSQNPFQQMPPYQGYPFTYMQPFPSQYPINMQWPPNRQPSPAKKEKHLNKNGSEYSSEEKQMESSGSEVGSDSDSDVLQEKKSTSTDVSYKKKHRKKSSKTVVIQNINYITPKRRNEEIDKVSDESDEDEYMDEESLKQNVGDAVEAWEKMHKPNSSKHKKKGLDSKNGGANELSDAPAQDRYNDRDSIVSETGKENENWDAFQNLLMRDEETTVNRNERLHQVDIIRSSGNEMALMKDHATADLESEKAPKQRRAFEDSHIVTQRDGEDEDRVGMGGFENGDDELRSVLKSRASAIEVLVIPQRIEESGSEMGHILSSWETKPSAIKPAKGDDWFIVNHSGKTDHLLVNNEHTTFDGSDLLSSGGATSRVIKNTKETLVDDSFMVHNQPSNDLYDSQWRTDISMVADLSLSSPQENGAAKHNHETMDGGDPNDLFMVLGHHGVESVRESWSTDLGTDISFMEAERRCSSVEGSDLVDKKSSSCDIPAAKKNEKNGKKVPSKEVRSKILPGSSLKNKTEMMSRVRKAPVVSRPTVQKSKLEKEEELRKKMEEQLIERQKRIAERTAAASKKTPSESKTHSTTRDTNRASSLRIRAI